MLPKKKKESRNKIRVFLKVPLKVTLGSIGSQVHYKTETYDISENGFFLDFKKPGKFPFNEASIIEAWLDLGNGESIFFNAKMARKVYPEQVKSTRQSSGIAIRIIQIEKQTFQALRTYIKETLEKQSHLSQQLVV